MTGARRNKTVTHPSWSQAFASFAQSSHVYGLRQVAEPTPFTCRRCVWLVLVCMGILLFIYQFYLLVLLYLSVPVHLSLNIRRNTSLIFPAITICNLNSIRQSVASDRGWTDQLRQVFSENASALSIGAELNRLDLDKVFEEGAHRKQQLLIECSFDGEICGSSDFRRHAAPDGFCFTFNGKEPAAKSSYLSEGLRLTMNVESYEYLPLPTSGMGLRVILHEPETRPDLTSSLLLRPGNLHQLLVGVYKMDLSPSESDCSSSGENRASCLYQCRVSETLRCCECREFWMSGTWEPRYPRCSVSSFIGCTRNVSLASCPCPPACRQIVFEPQLSSSDLSAYDVSRLLQLDDTNAAMQTKREALNHAEHTVPSLKRANEEMVDELLKRWQRLCAALVEIHNSIDRVRTFTRSLRMEIGPRLHFHINRGLRPIRDVVRDDFVEGWQIISAKSFDRLGFDFEDILLSTERALHDLHVTSNSEQLTRRFVFMFAERCLSDRLELSIRSLDNLTSVQRAFVHAEPLLVSPPRTPSRRYDALLVPRPIISHSINRVKSLSDKLTTNLGAVIQDTLQLKKMLKLAYKESKLNKTQLKMTRQQFLRHSSAIYSLRKEIQTTIVDRSLKLAEDKLEYFRKLNSSFVGDISELKAKLTSLNECVTRDFNNVKFWIDSLIEQVIAFSKNSSNLSQNDIAQSAERIDAWLRLRIVNDILLTLNSLTENLQQIWVKLRMRYRKLWTSMAEELCLREFYSMLEDDVYTSEANPEQRALLVPIFAQLLDIDNGTTSRFSGEELRIRLNADLPSTDVAALVTVIRREFNAIERDSDVSRILGDAGIDFRQTFRKFLEKLDLYREKSKLHPSFVRENMLMLRISLRDIFYQEISHVSSYSLTMLLSDIGGAMALLVGAGVITVVELVDLLLHTCAVRIANGRNTKRNDRHVSFQKIDMYETDFRTFNCTGSPVPPPPPPRSPIRVPQDTIL